MSLEILVERLDKLAKDSVDLHRQLKWQRTQEYMLLMACNELPFEEQQKFMKVWYSYVCDPESYVKTNEIMEQANGNPND